MELTEYAKLELKLAGLFDEKKDFYGGMTGKAVMELIETFANQGHSGMSANLVIDIFSKLAKYEALLPITGDDEEWVLLDYDGDITYQNKRCSGLFKNSDGIITYNSSIIKRCPNGITWSGPLYMTREDAINNINQIRVKIKELPFTPKTFYIDVIEEEIYENDWIMWVKEPSQLNEVWEYYEKY